MGQREADIQHDRISRHVRAGLQEIRVWYHCVAERRHTCTHARTYFYNRATQTCMALTVRGYDMARVEKEDVILS